MSRKSILGGFAFVIAGVSTALAQTPVNSAALVDRISQSRAVEAVRGMPAVNYDLMRQELLWIGGKENQVVYCRVRSTATTRLLLPIRTRFTSWPSTTRRMSALPDIEVVN